MADPKAMVQLKLLVDNETRKVLFAEAGKDLVDFLFCLLILPIGTVAKLVSSGTTTTMHGSVRRLYKSVDAMDASHFLPNIDKDELLCANLPPTGTDSGFLNGLATYIYMVTDGLEVTPMSAISSITLVNRFRVGNDENSTPSDSSLKKHQPSTSQPSLEPPHPPYPSQQRRIFLSPATKAAPRPQRPSLCLFPTTGLQDVVHLTHSGGAANQRSGGRGSAAREHSIQSRPRASR